MGPLADGALSLGVGIAVAPLVLLLLRKAQVLDAPNARSSHTEVTPRGGGLAPACACVVGAIASSELTGNARTGLLVTAIGMGLIGLADDLRPLAPLPRLVGQATVAVVAVAWVGTVPGTPVWEMTLRLGSVVWLVAYVNAFNFMDGINGISVAQVVVAGIAWIMIGHARHADAIEVSGVIVASAGLAFAPFNFGQARMFLGDVGSYFLGGWLAATVVLGLRSHVPPDAVLAPLVVYAADTFVTLVGRIARRQQWYRPHRQHTYQRLVQAGWSHGRTSLFVAAIVASCSCLGSLSLSSSMTLRVCGDVVGIGVVIAYLRVPAVVSRRRTRVPEIAPAD